MISENAGKMKKKDLVIVSHLRKNSRAVLASISRKSGLPISTVHDRIKGKVGGIVSKFSALLDYEALGFHARANVIVKVGKDDRLALKEYLKKSHSVNSLYKVNNGYDFMFECMFRNLIELENFLEKLEDKYDVQQREVFYIMGSLKQEEFMADPMLVDITMSGC